MLGMETVAERMADHIVGHHPVMPGVGKSAQTVNCTRSLEDTAHATIMTVVLCLRNGKDSGQDRSGVAEMASVLAKE
jgi:hypothetical protein